MQWSEILLSALVISVLNLASVVIGFLSYIFSGAEAQLLVQIPVSLISGVLLVIGWIVGFRRLHRLSAGEDFIAVMLVAYPMGAVIFTGVHYVVTGYLTSLGNIGPLWGLQLAENALALPVASFARAN